MNLDDECEPHPIPVVMQLQDHGASSMLHLLLHPPSFTLVLFRILRFAQRVSLGLSNGGPENFPLHTLPWFGFQAFEND